MAADIEAARLRLVTAAPYFGVVLFRLRTKVTPGLGTVKCGRSTLLIDPNPFTTEQLATILYHEIQHWVRDHHSRLVVGVDKQKADVACDLEINDDAPPKGLLPYNEILWPISRDHLAKPLFPRDFKLPDGKSAEWYYDHLPDPKGDEEGEQGKGPQGCGTLTDDESEGEGEGDRISEAEAHAIRDEVARQVEAAARQRGTVPDSLLAWALNRLRPVVRWEQLLRRYVRDAINIQAGLKERTYMRLPSRDYSPIITPAYVDPLIHVAIYVDTSGSVYLDQSLVERAIAEVKGIARATQSNCVLVHVDAEVHKVEKVNADIKLVGGGGTDMRLCFEHAKTLNPRPDVLVIITDGYTPWPKQPSKFRTIVVLTAEGGETPPSWAKVVEAREKGDE
jgi:predicted metal-dependent peptidase